MRIELRDFKSKKERELSLVVVALPNSRLRNSNYNKTQQTQESLILHVNRGILFFRLVKFNLQ